MVEKNQSCRDSPKRLEFQNVAVTRLHISPSPRDLATTSAVRVCLYEAKSNTLQAREALNPDDLAANGGSCGPISLCGILLEAKITPNGPGIRGNVA